MPGYCRTRQLIATWPFIFMSAALDPRAIGRGWELPVQIG